MFDRWRSRAGLAAPLAVAVVALAACGAGAPAAGTSTAAAPSTSPAPSTTAPPGPAVSTPATPAPSGTPARSPAPTGLGRGEGTVTVLTYRGYAEYGGNDPAVNWITAFERKTGCRVSLRVPQGGDDLDDLLDRVPFDVAGVPPEVGGRLIERGEAAPINTGLVPHYQDITERLRGHPSLRAGGRVYGVPFLWGTYLTLYEGKGARPATPAGLYSAEGPVLLRDSPLSIADAALALRRRSPELGITDPFALTPRQLDAATALLSARHGERVYWREPVEALRALAGGSVRAGRVLPYHLDALRRAGRPVKDLPAAPATGWIDSWMISTRAAAPNCAYRWIDWASTARVQQQAAVWNGLAPANPDACDRRVPSDEPAAALGLTARSGRMCAAYRVGDTSWLKKVAFAVRPGSGCAGCAGYAEWAERWRRLVP
ncbi:spermidine/putrescine ABC transporter substrate-binding protein [Sphaerisporangium rufum]|uniref:Spermidine/putrescine ABC transporter substrate-binding protein n=1 Tax=Sphaerisporangium rufum TaxID=1381558 RepID=A0A919R4C9_9ACTN|nr:extracellular solute-binding protein [Sphaerisporangium rufum]GII78181.1 spermidine/putrescine ABC transporter substrate-binding protein [Sphaerisporangium rufum]